MPAKYRFITNGDYVHFYDDAQLVTTIHNSSRDVSWSFDSTPGIIFEIDAHSYHTDDVGDISFDNVSITTQAEFVTAIQGIFPDLGGTDVRGIDDVLNEEQALTEPRTINLGGTALAIGSGTSIYDEQIVTNKIYISTSGGQILIKSPNGTTWIIGVDNDGQISITGD